MHIVRGKHGDAHSWLDLRTREVRPAGANGGKEPAVAGMDVAKSGRMLLRGSKLRFDTVGAAIDGLFGLRFLLFSFRHVACHDSADQLAEWLGQPPTLFWVSEPHVEPAQPSRQ